MNANKKIAFNSLIIFIRLCIVSVISLVCSRIVLDALGASDYGLYNVVGGIVTLLNVVNSSMMSTTYRFIAFELGRKHEGRLNRVFNNSFLIHAAFSFFIVLLGLTIGDWYIVHYLNVPSGKIDDALFVFHVSLATAAINTILVPFQGTLVAYERFSAIALIDIVTNILKIVAILLLIYHVGDRLRTYSIIMFFSLLLNSGGYFAYCLKRYAAAVTPHFSFDKTIMKEMLGFAFWTLFGACANIGKVQGSAVIINYFFGTIVNSAFAIANQVENFILMFARTLNNAAIPQITKSYGGGDQRRSIILTSYISKYTYMLMCLVAFPTILEMDFLLGLWLKEVPAGTTVFCQLIILGGLLDCLGAGIPALVNATGTIRNYQVILHTFTLTGLPIAFILYQLGFNQYTISVVYCVIIALCSLLRLILLKTIYHLDISIIIKISYIKIIYISAPLVFFYLLYNPVSRSVFGHVSGLLLSELFLLFVMAAFGMDNVERGKVLGYIRNKMNKK